MEKVLRGQFTHIYCDNAISLLGASSVARFRCFNVFFWLVNFTRSALLRESLATLRKFLFLHGACWVSIRILCSSVLPSVKHPLTRRSRHHQRTISPLQTASYHFVGSKSTESRATVPSLEFQNGTLNTLGANQDLTLTLWKVVQWLPAPCCVVSSFPPESKCMVCTRAVRTTENALRWYLVYEVSCRERKWIETESDVD